MTPEFHSRMSKVGYHLACTQRAFYDASLQLGYLTHEDLGLTQQTVEASSAPADWGTVCHWYTQVGLRCDFKGKDTPNAFTYEGWDDARAIKAKFTDEQWKNGITLIGGEAAAKAKAVEIASLIASRVRGIGDKWFAEMRVETDIISGTLDLLTHDFRHLVDIKTTGNKPPGGRMRPSHMWQLIGYAWALAQHSRLVHDACVVYADRHGEWCCRTKPLKFTDQDGRDLLMMFERRVKRMGDFEWLEANALPNIGECCDDFCPYVGCCRDRYLPAGAGIYNKPEATITSTPPLE
jgi:hypothetical protein